MDYGADKETKDFARECMIKGEIPGLTGEAIAIIFGAVPIVRCKECRHSYDEPGGRVCSRGPCVDCIVADDFFCKYGEPAEEEPAKDGERRPCAWCWFARDREDVAGVYCTKGFENPDGTCTRFKSYEEMRDKGVTE